MIVRKIKERLQDFIDKLDNMPDDKEINLRPNTFRIADEGNTFIGFTGYDGGYLALTDIEQDDDELMFLDIEDFINYLYDEVLHKFLQNFSQAEVKLALQEMFKDNDIDELYHDFFESEFRKDSVREVVKAIKEVLE